MDSPPIAPSLFLHSISSSSAYLGKNRLLIGCGQNKTLVVIEDMEKILMKFPSLLRVFSTLASSKPTSLFSGPVKMLGENENCSSSENSTEDYLNQLLMKKMNEKIKMKPEFAFEYSFSDHSTTSENRNSSSSLFSIFEDLKIRRDSLQSNYSSKLPYSEINDNNKNYAYYSLVNRIPPVQFSKSNHSIIAYKNHKPISIVDQPNHTSKSYINISSKLLHSPSSSHRLFFYLLQFIIFKILFIYLDSSDILFVTFQTSIVFDLGNESHPSHLPSISSSPTGSEKYISSLSSVVRSKSNIIPYSVFIFYG
jgi:hypothetical protein